MRHGGLASVSLHWLPSGVFPGDSAVKNPPAKQETQVQSLGQEDPLVKEMATHSSSLAWKIPHTEEPDRLQSMGSERVGHDWVTGHTQHAHLYVPHLLYQFIHWWVLRLLPCFHLLAVVNNDVIEHRYLFKLVFSCFLNKHPIVEYLDNMAVAVLIFWRTSFLFFIVAVSSYIPTTCVQESLFLHILFNICCFLSFP